MGGNRILIISNHPLFAEAITHVLQDEGIQVAEIAPDVKTALPLLKKKDFDTIIVDYNEDHQLDTETVALLHDSSQDQQVIFLTLAGNQMVVHHRQRVSDATPVDLVSVLRSRFSDKPN